MEVSNLHRCRTVCATSNRIKWNYDRSLEEVSALPPDPMSHPPATMCRMTTNPIWIPEDAIARGEFTCVGACGKTLPIKKFPTPSGVPGGQARIIECRACRDARHPNKGGNGAPPPWESGEATSPTTSPATSQVTSPVAADAKRSVRAQRPGVAGPPTVVALRFRDPVSAHLWLARSQVVGAVSDDAELEQIFEDGAVDALLDGAVLFEAVSAAS